MNGNEYLKKFKVAFSIFAVGIILFIILLIQVIPKLQEVTRIQKDTQSQSEALADAERKLEEMQKALTEKKETGDVYLKAFYKPINEGLDSEAVISEEFAEILQIMRENKIKTRAIKYDYDPQDDNFVKSVPNQFHVCRITTDMVATYTEFESFLRDLYRHEHFLDISKIEIVPYQKNKKILLINLQIKLYAQKDPSSEPVVRKTESQKTTDTPPNIVQNSQRVQSEAGVTPAINAEEL